MNLNFDMKEKQLLDFYCDKIKERTFDEHDIYAFYILIRGHLENTEKYDRNNSTNSRKYKWISELGDLIAHRERREGVVWQNIINALQNGYQTISGSNEILDYKGIADGELQNEFAHLFGELNCQVTSQILDEIVLCTFSILQSSRYVDKQKNIVIYRRVGFDYSRKSTRQKTTVGLFGKTKGKVYDARFSLLV